MTIIDFIINSMENTAQSAYSYASLGDDTADNRSILIAKLNEAYGKGLMGYQVLTEQGDPIGAKKVLDYFNSEIDPHFDRMLKKFGE